MKIGIVTFHKAHNYGAMLQAFALTKKLNNHEAKIINYYVPKVYDRYKVIKKANDKSVQKKIKEFLANIYYYNKNVKRYKNFEKFINNHCKLTSEIFCTNDLYKEIEKFEVLITGSDQVWSPTIVGELSDIYTLNFDANVKKISYAASVGDATQITKNKEVYKNKISQIDYISVREQDAKDELSKLINKPIATVLDPTLLLTKEEWENELEEMPKIKEKYILAYVVEPNEEYIKIVNKLSEKTGLKVIHFGRKNPGYKNVLKSAYTEGPLEFVNYIKNAEYVIATSFHATAFSIIFNKKFFIVPHKKTGARVTNILDKLKIEGRTCYTLEEFTKKDYNLKTNWELVNVKLGEEKKKSIEWLNYAIEKE